MTTIRDLIADVSRKERRFEELILPQPSAADYFLADALLASPELAAILDYSAYWAFAPSVDVSGPQWPFLDPEVRSLLQSWRASRAEQKPTT